MATDRTCTSWAVPGKLMSTTGTVSREVNLGHVLFGVSCAIQTLETCIAVTKGFINLNVNVLRRTEQHDQHNGCNQFYSTDLSSRSSHENQAD